MAYIVLALPSPLCMCFLSDGKYSYGASGECQGICMKPIRVILSFIRPEACFLFFLLFWQIGYFCLFKKKKHSFSYFCAQILKKISELLCIYIILYHIYIWKWKCYLVVSDSLWSHGSSCLWNSPGKNTGLCSHSLLQGIFPSQGLNPDLLHWGQTLYPLSHKERLEIH